MPGGVKVYQVGGLISSSRMVPLTPASMVLRLLMQWSYLRLERCSACHKMIQALKLAAPDKRW